MTLRHLLPLLLACWSATAVASAAGQVPSTTTPPAASPVQPAPMPETAVTPPAAASESTAASPAPSQDSAAAPTPAPRTRRPARAAVDQAVPGPVPPPAAPPGEAEDAGSGSPPNPCDEWRRDPLFRLGQDYVIGRGDAVHSATAVAGDVLVEGHVCGDMSVTLGDVRLVEGASVEGTLVLVGGTLTVEPGASVNGELVLVGGALHAPSGFRAGRGHVVVGSPLFADHLRGFSPYLTRGLLLGRLIVPWLPWVWAVVLSWLLVQLVLNLLFPQATWATAGAIVDRPLSTFAAGVLVLVLTPPVMALLAVTVVGIAALPVLLAALVAAGIIGKIAVARWIGMSLVPQPEPTSRLQSTRSFLIGAVVITAAYMMPIIGIIAWGLTSVLGLGAASVAFIRAFRRENPPSSPRVRASAPPVVPPVAPAVVPPVPAVGAGAGPAVAVDAGADAPTYRSAPADPFGGAPAFAGPAPSFGAVGGGAAVAATDPRVLLGFPRAEFGIRVAAFLLDVLLVSLVGGLVAELFGADEPGNFVALLLLAYYATFWALKATTVGGIICQLRVVRVDAQPLRPMDAVVRTFTAVLSVAAFGLGMLWVLYDPEKQSWQDKVAGTYVVKVPRHYPV